MRRRTLDALLTTGGLIVATVLLVAGGLLSWANNFVDDNVRTQLAAQNATNEQLEAIKRAYDQMCLAADGKLDPVAADGAFHGAIISATNNRFFQPFGPLIRTALTVTAPTTNAITGPTTPISNVNRGLMLIIMASRNKIAIVSRSATTIAVEMASATCSVLYVSREISTPEEP